MDAGCAVVSITDMSPKMLRDLAAAIEWNSPGSRARRSLSSESVEELAAMMVTGQKPVLGWWRRRIQVGDK